MKQKKIFKRRYERHPAKWAAVGLGLFSLSFASFSAGVQFGQMDLEENQSSYVEMQATYPTRVALHSKD